jgi:hypothetical protein
MFVREIDPVVLQAWTRLLGRAVRLPRDRPLRRQPPMPVPRNKFRRAAVRCICIKVPI